ncbi:unnamed protein product [Adineta steineri]|uniref:Uncharacterized protein n=1 Tax=Adineta steineri TaxID=433720 RepID=A0A813S639_9BILA|nr:unnamed protein product [Adineta steineri]CAF0801054.1 unnamed protein product [Adineta steineri]CAF3664947.1 unnamed protein product [Adineta steineri]CAF3682933.1 unnamed protein product [Adineta steineri]
MYWNENPSELPQEQIRRLQNDLNTHMALDEELRKQLTQNNVTDSPHEKIKQLQENLNHQIGITDELSTELNNLHKLVDELRDMIIKQNAKIIKLENELEHEKKLRSMIPEAVS